MTGWFRSSRLSLLLAVLLHTSLCFSGEHFKIASFNVQVFGQKKASKPEVMDVLAKITKRYDIILIQEIRDKSEQAIYKLLDAVNSQSSIPYNAVVSSRLGRTTSKEQYAFLYRNDTVAIRDAYVTADDEDVYEREPFAVLVHSSRTKVEDFILLGIHVKPDDVITEVNALKETVREVVAKWQVENVIIMGDMNADCSYLSRKSHEQLILHMDKNFHWLLDDGEDTTVSDTDCSYDRFILSGPELIQSVEAGSSKVFLFNQAYNLTQQKALEVSDHYPIELALTTTSMALTGTAVSVLPFKSFGLYSLIIQYFVAN